MTYEAVFVGRVKRDFIRLAGRGVIRNWSEAAKHFGVNRQTLVNWGLNDPTWKRGVMAALGGDPERTNREPLPDFETFRTECFGHQPLTHQREWLEAVESHERTLILVPPAHGKTFTWAIEYPVYRICQDPNVRIIIVCKNQEVAKKRLYAIKTRLANNRFYQNGGWRDPIMEWGPFEPNQAERRTLPWTSELIYVSGVDSGEKDATVEVLGLGNQIQGARADVIILDDVADMKNQMSPKAVEDQIEWLGQEVVTRLSAEGKMIIIGTRVNELDIYSHILSDDQEWAADFARVVQPAILDEEKKLVLWPEEWSYDTLVTKRRGRLKARNWALVYQQQSTGMPDAPFRLEVLEASKDPVRRVGQIPEGLPVVLGVDPATEGSCAIVVLAVDRATGMRYVIDCIAKSGLGHREAIKAEIVYAARRYNAIRAKVEQNFGQLGDDPELFARLHAVNCHLEPWDTLPGVGVTGRGAGKYDENWGVLATAGRFAEGKFSIPAGPGADQHMRPLLDELAIWRPQAKTRQDRVMALWFADVCAQRLGIFKVGTIRKRSVPPWVRKQPIPRWVNEQRVVNA